MPGNDIAVKADGLDILFISPSLDYTTERLQKSSMRIEKNIPNQETPPLNIGYLLATAKRNGLRVKFIDMVIDCVGVEELLDFVAKAKPALIGFTAFTKQIGAAGKISEKIKRKTTNAAICVGGCHAIALPVQTLEEFPYIDFVFLGEAEEQLPTILEYLNNPRALAELPGVVTRISKNVPPVFIEDLDKLPFPAWEEFDLTKYPGNLPHQTKLELPMITSRGCPYGCTFCCRANGSRIRYRSIPSVISEIERNIEEFGCEAIVFNDENLVLDKKRAEHLFFELNKRGLNKKIKWGCCMRIDKATPELMKDMKKAGCFHVFFGFESANDATLKRIQKGTSVSQMLPAVKAAKQAGIVPVGAFMIGLPGDTTEDVYRSIELGKKLDLFSITFPIAVPYPGTVLREQALRNMYGMKILSSNWDYYGRKEVDSTENFELLESKDLTAGMMKELQEIAYSQHPKKKWDEYLSRLSE